MTENVKSCALISSTINKITWLIKKSKVSIGLGKENDILNIMLPIKMLTIFRFSISEKTYEKC